ncbi:hypothetical protein Hanom_Chr11g00983771 [Helianthus anomalus]
MQNLNTCIIARHHIMLSLILAPSSIHSITRIGLWSQPSLPLLTYLYFTLILNRKRLVH